MVLRKGLLSAGENGNYLEAWKTYTIFATQISKHGVVVQLVRIPACHAGGRGFESRPFRQLSRDNKAPEGAFFMPEFYLPANIRYN